MGTENTDLYAEHINEGVRREQKRPLDRCARIDLFLLNPPVLDYVGQEGEKETHMVPI